VLSNNGIRHNAVTTMKYAHPVNAILRYRYGNGIMGERIDLASTSGRDCFRGRQRCKGKDKCHRQRRLCVFIGGCGATSGDIALSLVNARRSIVIMLALSDHRRPVAARLA
jgi:hypothetical protein